MFKQNVLQITTHNNDEASEKQQAVNVISEVSYVTNLEIPNVKIIEIYFYLHCILAREINAQCDLLPKISRQCFCKSSF